MTRPSFLSPRILALLGIAGCNGILDISPPVDGDDDGSSGSSGTGNASSSGGNPAGTGGAGEGGAAGESGAGEGGAAGESGAGESVGGQATGGAAGTAAGSRGGGASGSSASGGVSGTAGGEAGAGPAKEFPDKHDPCSSPGALACAGPAQKLRLICNGGLWKPTDDCTVVEGVPAYCDRRTGTCGKEVCENPNEPLQNTCNRDTHLTCGPDRVTLGRVECVLGCLGSDRCNTPTTDQLIIDKNPRAVAVEYPYWPDPIIPVCWSDWSEPDDDALALERAAIQRSVDGTWGRVSGLGFTGWKACRPDEARVELRFVDDCRGELARLPRVGYPGPGAPLPVEICKSYYGADHPRSSEPLELDVMTLVARHVFGHVVGFEDNTYDQYGNVMVPVIELSNFAGVGIYWEDGLRLQDQYGSKPGHALVGPDGRCVVDDSGTLALAACDGSNATRWQPGPSELRHVSSGDCLRENAGSVDLAACDGTTRQEWKLGNVRIRDRDGWCLVPGGSFPNDAALVSVSCNSGWPAEQRFELEFVEPGAVRIHTTQNRCITAPPTFTGLPVPGFGPCDGERDEFEVFEGTLSQRGWCLTTDQGTTIAFEPCNGFPPQHFYLSGPIEHEGNALTLEAAGAFSSTTLEPIPTPNQVYDYHF